MARRVSPGLSERILALEAQDPLASALGQIGQTTGRFLEERSRREEEDRLRGERQLEVETRERRRQFESDRAFKQQQRQFRARQISEAGRIRGEQDITRERTIREELRRSEDKQAKLEAKVAERLFKSQAKKTATLEDRREVARKEFTKIVSDPDLNDDQIVESLNKLRPIFEAAGLDVKAELQATGEETLGSRALRGAAGVFGARGAIEPTFRQELQPTITERRAPSLQGVGAPQLRPRQTQQANFFRSSVNALAQNNPELQQLIQQARDAGLSDQDTFNLIQQDLRQGR